MSLLYEMFLKLNCGKHLSEDELVATAHDRSIKDFQISSLLASIILRGDMNNAERAFVDTFGLSTPSPNLWLKTLKILVENNSIDKKAQLGFETDLMERVFFKKEIGPDKLSFLIRMIVVGSVDNNFLAILLVLILHKGLAWQDTLVFTDQMAKSGRIYDYRNNHQLEDRKIIRRYPTGAVSEKIALIMPSLLMAFSDRLPICSPFIVAKSLSFTGGTWDKLSTIPGFRFPLQGDETIEVLKACNISMTVTEGDFNPADRLLYQFRSITNTVESHPLILSSVASKQIAVPADSLLMDIRYGNGAFLEDLNEAKELGDDFVKVLRGHEIKTRYLLTDTSQPNGSCIGNYWEVLEAISIMKNFADFSGYNFDMDGMKEQKSLVIEMTTELLCLQFNLIDRESIKQEATKYFEDGKVFDCFLRLLKLHQVEPHTIKQISNNRTWIPSDFIESRVIASKTGILGDIRQKEIGAFVNFQLGCGLNEYHRMPRSLSGVILQKRKADFVHQGDVLARVMHDSAISKDCLFDHLFFSIKE